MVHRRSTYSLMFRNYGESVRRRVYLENNRVRERRRVEEMSHQSLEEDYSDRCDCDDSDNNSKVSEGPAHKMDSVSVTGRPPVKMDSASAAWTRVPAGGTDGLVERSHPAVPRLHFTPDVSPRVPQDIGATNDLGDDFTRDGASVKFDDQRGSMPDLNLGTGTGGRQSARLHLRGKPGVSGEQVGVMRPGSGVKEYDLIPAVPQEAGPAQRGPVVPQDTSPAQRGPAVPQGAGIAERGPAVPKAALSRSFMCPLTSKLSRTTRTNFQCRERTIYVPYGTGADVMAIGDKTSFNIHLSENQVRPTSLHASSLRNREIERLITKQRRMTLDDMRDRGRVDAHVNHSSIWGEAFSTGTKPWQQQSDKRGGAISAGTAPQQRWNDSREHISSRQKPRLWQKDMRREVFSTRTKPRQLQNDTQNRVEVLSNYCRHCGGRK